MEKTTLRLQNDILKDLHTKASEFVANEKHYDSIYAQMLEYLNSLVDAKLTDNEKNIYFARIGITQEESTLEKIGEQEGVTKERIRQILVICKQKLTDLLKLDQETKTLRELKHKLLTNIKKVSYSGFAIYLACKEQINLLKDFFRAKQNKI